MPMIFPREALSPDNYGPVVHVITWILLVSMILSVCAKVAMKVVAMHSFNTDDMILTASMVYSPGVLPLLILDVHFT